MGLVCACTPGKKRVIGWKKTPFFMLASFLHVIVSGHHYRRYPIRLMENNSESSVCGPRRRQINLTEIVIK